MKRIFIIIVLMNILLCFDLDAEIEELIYDNNAHSGFYLWLEGTMATRMSPADDCQILKLKFYTNNDGFSGGNFLAKVFNWSGSQPGNEIFSTQATCSIDSWYEIDISDENIFVSEDFAVGFTAIDSSATLGYNEIDNGRSWDFTQSWNSWSETYFIRAIVDYGDAQGVLNEDFLQGIPDEWTIIDADGDSFGWEIYDLDGHNDESCVRSASYISGIGALEPDNYLISPEIAINSSDYVLNYWVKPFDDYFVSEHYKIKIAVTDSLDLLPEYFTEILFEETLEQNIWQERQISLTGYAEQNIYIAWEHCNVTDQYYMMLDDVIVSDSISSSAEDDILPADPILFQNYPNPFHTSTAIKFTTGNAGKNAEILIYNLKGQKVKTFPNLQISKSPNQQIFWDGKDEEGKQVSSGIYLYKLHSGKTEISRKMILLK